MKRLLAGMVLMLAGATAQAGVSGYTCYLSNVQLEGKGVAVGISTTTMAGTGEVVCLEGVDFPAYDLQLKSADEVIASLRVRGIKFQGVRTPVKVYMNATGLGPVVGYHKAEKGRVVATAGIALGDKNQIFGTYWGGRVAGSLVQPQGGVSMEVSKGDDSVSMGLSVYVSMITEGARLGLSFEGTKVILAPVEQPQYWTPIQAN
ncbi:MAG: hypothetical protein KDD22_06295 [Bdellovibrionales bacterium]|nr:hypothetical protein [Bdellovibrionales bacterium]